MNIREALMQIARERGAEPEQIDLAFRLGTPSAIANVLDSIDKADDAIYLIPKLTREFVHIGLEQQTFIDLVEILIQRPHDSMSLIAQSLSQTSDARAENLLRQSLELPWPQTKAYENAIRDVSKAITALVYEGDYGRTLMDPMESVRREAVRWCEKEDNTDALLFALQDTSVVVRHTAVWYMGRKRVAAAIPRLIALIPYEKDLETLRGSIWSLGVLQAVEARSILEAIRDHPNPLIRQTVQEALGRLA